MRDDKLGHSQKRLIHVAGTPSAGQVYGVDDLPRVQAFETDKDWFVIRAKSIVHRIHVDKHLTQRIRLDVACGARTRPPPPSPQTGGCVGILGPPELSQNPSHFAGLPGKAYAKILQDVWTSEMPAASYWNPTHIVSDNRISALETDSTTYRFEIPEDAQLIIQVQLLFRRAYKPLADQKGWEIPDILMTEREIVLY